MKIILQRLAIATLLIFGALLFAEPKIVFAAEVYFVSPSHSVVQGDKFTVQLLVNTQNEVVNAVEGLLTFPADLLEVKEIRDGNSVINIWIEKPKNNNPGLISFAGITPGGFSGTKKMLLSVIFQAKKSGIASLVTTSVRILRHDELSSAAKIHNSPFAITIQRPVTTQPVPPIPPLIIPPPPVPPLIVNVTEDVDPPEDFLPIIVSDPSVFDGKFMLIFVTQDKGTGVARYEVQEGNGAFIIAESPYLLTNQSVDSKITVKAIDFNGNERIRVLTQAYNTWWLLFFELAGGLFLLYVALMLIFKKGLARVATK